MQFVNAIDRMIMATNRGEPWRAILGAYPGGATVRIERDHEREPHYVGIPFAVTITYAATSLPTETCNGLGKVKSLLRREQLPVTDGEWSIEQHAVEERTKA